jgi:hypothetical protein
VGDPLFPTDVPDKETSLARMCLNPAFNLRLLLGLDSSASASPL